jgi:amino acid adenylation domain-containing protein
MDTTKAIRHNIAEDFWIQKLEGLNHCPLFQGINGSGSSERLKRKFDFPEELSKSLDSLSRNNEASAFIILASALHILLFKYTGSEDILISSTPPKKGKNNNNEEVFLFLRMVNANFCTPREVINDILEQLNVASEHYEFSYDTFKQRFCFHQKDGGNLLNQFGLIYKDFNRSFKLTDDINLLFAIEKNEHGYVLNINYNSNLYSEQHVKQLGGHFINVLSILLSDVDKPVSEIDLLNTEEKRTLLVEFNNTITTYPRDKTLVDLFDDQVQINPDLKAVVFQGEYLTYGELQSESSRLASHLVKNCDIKPGDRIGVMVERSDRLIIALLGILRSGACYVPIDPDYPQKRTAYMLAETDVKVLLTDSGFLYNVMEFYKGEIIALDLQLPTLPYVSDLFSCPVSSTDLAYIMFTSGSTGMPKGVMVEHRSVVRLVKNTNYINLKSGQKLLQTGSLSFDAMTFEVWGMLLNGGELHLLPNRELLEVSMLRKKIIGDEIDVIWLTSSWFNQLADSDISLFSKLSYLLVGGEQLSPKHINKVRAAFPELVVINGYGPTENTTFSTAYIINTTHNLGIPIGKPISNSKAYILDQDEMPVPIGVTGEIYLGGDGLARGYWKQDDLTSEKFVKSIIEGEERLYRTGDLGKWNDEGLIEFLGRKDSQVKIRGYRIELKEIEISILKHAEIEDCAVITINGNENQQTLVAYYVAEKEITELLRGFLVSSLPAYMVPAYFIRLDRLPLTKNGKLDKDALPDPESTNISLEAYEPPVTDLQRVLSEIWQEILGIEKIGINDNFFHLGGDSIKGIRTANKIYERLGEIVHVAILFETPTISELAQNIAGYKENKIYEVNSAKLEELRSIITPLPALNKKIRKNPPALFILSPPRAGSTLLRSILAGHSMLFSPPELELLGFNTLADRKKEFSGKFSFYAEGTLRALIELKKCSPEEALSIIETYEKENYTIQEFYGILQSELNGRLLVDKSPFYSLDTEILKRAEDYFELPYYIHLQRHPYGMIHSFEEAKIDQIFRHNHPFSTRELAELVWTLSVQNIAGFLESIPDERKHIVKYEELVTNADEVVKGICDFLCIEYQEEMLKLYEKPKERMMDGVYPESKTIGDIKILSHTHIDPVSASRWSEKYTESFLGSVTVDTARSIGYQVDVSVQANMDILVVPQAEYYEVSHAQKRLWILSQFDEASVAYNSPRAFILEGKLNIQAFAKVFETVVQRHESLRTTFTILNGEPKQKINDANSGWFYLEYTDLRNDADRESKVKVIAESESKTVFNLQEGPLLKAKLFQMNEDRYIFLLTMHHIITDGWSMGVLVKEILKLYDAYCLGLENPLKPLKIQYKDYAAWQNSQLSGGMLKQHQDYWIDHFKGELPVLDFPADYSRPPRKTYNGGRINFMLDKFQKDSLNNISQKNGASLFMVLLATVKTMLYKYTGQEDMIIGSPMAGREHPGLEDQIGFYINTLAIRTSFNGYETFQELLDKVRTNVLNAYSHQEYPFDKLVDDLSLERDMSRSPLFDVAVVLQNTEVIRKGEGEMEGIMVYEYDTDLNISKFDVSFTFVEIDKSIVVTIDYNTDLFTKSRIERLEEHYKNLIQALITNPECSLNKLNYLSDKESNQLLVDFNETISDYPHDKTIHQLFEEQVKKTPDAVAVEFENKQLTYSELNGKANQLAHYLRSKYEIVPDTLIGLMIDRSDLLIISLLGIIKSGAAYVPIDPEYPQERINFILSDAHIKILLTDSNHLFDISEQYSGELFAVDIQLPLLEESTVNPEQINKPEDLAYTIYTSGSTGLPKGVMVAHEALNNLCHWHKSLFSVKETSHATIYSGIGFDACTWEIWPYLLSGSCLHPIKNENRYNLRDLVDFIINRSVTHCFLPTPVCEQLNALEELTLNENLTVLTGGDRLHINSDLKFKLINNYGPTEAAVVATSVSLNDISETSVIPIGRPIANTRIYILDESLNLVPVGITGEIYIAGAGLARGYINDPELTKEKFIDNPITGERMYASNDLGRWLSTGNIEFVGRKDTQVKIRGYRIELGEIENLLLQYNVMNSAAVVARNYGNGEKQLAAYYTSSVELAPALLRNYLGQYLPAYMIPSYFIQLEKLPLTSNGKVDYKSLPEPLKSGLHTGTEYVEPRTQLEEKLVQFWEKILVRTPIGINDNFFELGGHSIKGMQLIATIYQNLNVKLELGNLFAYPTISELAEIINLAVEVPYKTIEPIQEQSYYEISHAQKRIWVLSQFEDGKIAYNIPKAYICDGNLNFQAFVDAFKSLVQRHESLRTTFITLKGEVKQVIHTASALKFKVEHVDIRGEQDKEARVKELADLEAKVIFDLEKGPLLKLKLIQTEEECTVILFTIHHIITDGWSMEVMIRDLLQFYNAYSLGHENPLIPLKIQYKDYAFWQNKQLQEASVLGHQSYWLNQFEGEVPVLEFPVDYPRPVVKTYNGNRKSFILNKTFKDGLTSLGHEHGASLFMTLLSTLKVLFYKYTGQQDMVIGSPIAGREYPGLDDQIGYYLNTLPIRTPFSENQCFEDLLNQIKINVLNAYAHQVYPFDKLVDDLILERDMSRSPLFDVMMVLQNTELPGNVEEGASGICIKEYHADFNISKFDITFSFIEVKHGISFTIEYNTDLFKESSINRLAEHYINLVKDIIEHSKISLWKLKCVSDEEVSLLNSFNDTAADYPREATIQQLFENQVYKTPDAIAIVYENQLITYTELNEKSNKLAYYLRDNYHIKPDELIGLKMERSDWLIIGILGIVKAGGAYFPVGAEYPEKTIQHMLKEAAVKIVITCGESFNLENEPISHLDLKETWAEISTHPTKNLVNVNKPHDLVYLMYTSGSTGQPKGVAIEHKSVVRLVKNTNYITIDEGSSLLQTGAVSFDATTFEIWGMLLNGGSLHLLPYNKLMDVDSLKEKLLSGINIAWFTSSWFNELVDIDSSIFSKLSYLLVGGDKLSPRHINKVKIAYPELRIINGYGPTENTTFSLCYTIDEYFESSIPIGKPVSNSTAYILDKHMQLVPVGIAGEIYLGGDGLARGYWKQDELTREKFVNNPFSDSESKLYRTGDLGKWSDNGTMEFLGRNDSQVKRRGFRIELEAIRNALLLVKNIEKVEVLNIYDHAVEEELVAFYSGKNINAAALNDHLVQLLPFYMVPDKLISIKQFPLTLHGKTDGKELIAIAKNYSSINKAKYIAPRNEQERQLVKIWSAILQRKHIAIQDNFFDLGGHSLKAIRMISKLYEVFDVKLDLRTVFVNPTVEKLARVIQEAVKERYEPITPVGRKSYYPVSHAQKRLWLLSQFEDQQSVYNISMAYLFKEKINIQFFIKAFETLVERHEILRTIITTVDGEPVQQILADEHSTFQVTYIDLSNEINTEIRAREIANQEANTVFNLSESPPLKVKLLKTGEDTYVFLFTMHHIISDGWSMEIIVKEILTLYNAYKNGDKNPLKPLRIHYKDFAVWQQEQLSEEKIKGYKEYWLEQLKYVVPLNLPIDYPRPLLKTYNGNKVEFVLNNSIGKALYEFSREQDASMFMTMLAAIKALLYYYTDQEDIIIGSPIAGRDHPDLENQIGFYVNMLALKTKINAEENFKEVLNNVKATVLEAYKWQNYPFDCLIDDLNIERDLSRSILYDVGFSWHLKTMNNDDDIGLNIQTEKYDKDYNIAKTDLWFHGFELVNDEILLSVEYNVDLFEPETILIMLQKLKILIQEIIKEPIRPLHRITIELETEKKFVKNIAPVKFSFGQ